MLSHFCYSFLYLSLTQDPSFFLKLTCRIYIPKWAGPMWRHGITCPLTKCLGGSRWGPPVLVQPCLWVGGAAGPAILVPGHHSAISRLLAVSGGGCLCKRCVGNWIKLNRLPTGNTIMLLLTSLLWTFPQEIFLSGKINSQDTVKPLGVYVGLSAS